MLTVGDLSYDSQIFVTVTAITLELRTRTTELFSRQFQFFSPNIWQRFSSVASQSTRFLSHLFPFLVKNHRLLEEL